MLLFLEVEVETRTNQTPPPPTTDPPPTDINRRNGPIVTTDNIDQGQEEEVAPTFTTTQNPLTISTTEDPLGYVHTAGEHL